MDLNYRFSNARALTRREFFKRGGLSLGGMALGSMLAGNGYGAAAKPGGSKPFAVRPPTFPGRAKSVIYLHMSGAPPSLDLFDYKPKLNELHMKPCPDELIKGQKFAFIKGVPKLLASPHTFKQYGKSGMWISDLLPHTAKIVDDLCFIRSMKTDHFNHGPAQVFMNSGHQIVGRPSIDRS
jgi:hypothetical protein